MRQKRLLGILLAFCLLLSVLPVQAFAADTLIYKVGENGYLGLNRYTGTLENAVNIEGDLIIPSSIEGVSVRSIADATFEGFENLKSVTIPDSVTSIGDRAFWACTRLETVVVPKGVTYLGKDAFHYCYSLENVSLPVTLTSIESSTFASCIALKSITIPSGVVSMGSYVFQDCTGLTNVTLPSGMKEIGEYTFSGCTTLEEIDLPNSLTQINTALFDGCTALRSVQIPSSVKSIGKSAFGKCTSLEKLVLPEGVEKLYDWAFDRCTALTQISMPDSITSIAADSFYGCENVTFYVNAGSYSQVFASANHIPFELGTLDDDEKPSTPFVDIEGHWGEDAIIWAYEQGLFNGTSETKFSPNGNVNRAMFVEILYRLEGKPAAGTSSFTDVLPNAYYAKAVAWAEKNNIVSGTGNGKFSPAKSITREQFATMLYRYAEYKGMNLDYHGDLSQFVDSYRVSSYAQESLSWAVGAGVVTGKNGQMLDPKGNATRAEAATMLQRFVS